MQTGSENQFIGSLLWDIVDVVTFGALEKDPHEKAIKNPHQQYRNETGACVRNDTYESEEGKDYFYTSGGSESYCRTKCNAATTCAGYEFNLKEKACKHLYWKHNMRGNHTDYIWVYNDNKTFDSNNTGIISYVDSFNSSHIPFQRNSTNSTNEDNPPKFCNLKC